MAPKSTLEVATQIRETVLRLGELPQRHASRLVKMFDVPYTDEGIGFVNAALADCGLESVPRLAVHEPGEAVRVVLRDEDADPNTFCGISIKDGRIESVHGGGPLAGAHAVVDAAGQLTSRITATRLVLTGALALAIRKKVDNRELYLLVEGPGWAISVAVDPTRGAEARAFAARINAAASAAAPANDQAPAVSSDIPDQIRKLGELRDAGLLTDAEFDAKKTELLSRL
jgi:hypothetical protein